MATGQAIQLTIHDFDLEANPDCRFDVLEVINSMPVVSKMSLKRFSKSIARPNEIHIEEKCNSEKAQKNFLIKMLLCS